jgi:hypothetical protein
MKTLIVYFEEFPKCVIVDGDYTKFHNFYYDWKNQHLIDRNNGLEHLRLGIIIKR